MAPPKAPEHASKMKAEATTEAKVAAVAKTEAKAEASTEVRASAQPARHGGGGVDGSSVATDVAIGLALLALAVWSRVHLIAQPNFVAWDESHFGKFAGWTVMREFYMDVHPPLGKMTLGGIAYLAGYDGSFKFDSGMKYPDQVPYIFMRSACAIISALVVPVVYVTSRQLDMSRQASVLTATMIMLDMTNIVLGRFILLDGMLMLGTALSVMCLAGFRGVRDSPFSLVWWAWLLGNGLSLGYVMSVKWIGFFVLALVGLYTVADLWMLLTDKRVSIPKFLLHFLARALCLIVVPVGIYVLAFVAHFAVLTHSGPGDATMPSLFQANLNGSDFATHPSYMAYGSIVTLRSNALDGALLHSHVQTYPSGSKQQQVTTYPHHDANNYWFVVKASDRTANPNTLPIEFVVDGDIVILRHNATSKNLHSHNVAAPLTKSANEVSGYGGMDWGDENDKWKIEILADDILGRDPSGRIHSLTTTFRLRHIRTDCILWTEATTLPDWGFRQHEVTCRKGDLKGSNVAWNVEEHINRRLPRNSGLKATLPFWRAFLELNAAMMSSNNALLPDPNKVDELASPPSYWPLMYKGVRTTSWAESGTRVYMLGNPVLWWGGLVAFALWAAMALVHAAQLNRSHFDWSSSFFTPREWQNFYVHGLMCLGGWMLHYLPFFFMVRLTYLHHYVPSVLFLALMSGVVCDHITALTVLVTSSIAARLRRSANGSNPDLLKTKQLQQTATWYTYARTHPFLGHAAVILLSIVVAVFAQFYPISYGMRGPLTLYTHLQWRPTWHVV